jgi:hypothetical protein
MVTSLLISTTVQGILDPAFLKHVQPVSICPCTKSVPDVRLSDGSQRISMEVVLEMLMEVEATIYGVRHAGVYGREKKSPSVIIAVKDFSDFILYGNTSHM